MRWKSWRVLGWRRSPKESLWGDGQARLLPRRQALLVNPHAIRVDAVLEKNAAGVAAGGTDVACPPSAFIEHDGLVVGKAAPVLRHLFDGDIDRLGNAGALKVLGRADVNKQGL